MARPRGGIFTRMVDEFSRMTTAEQDEILGAFRAIRLLKMSQKDKSLAPAAAREMLGYDPEVPA